MKTQQVRGLECWFEMCQPQITCFFLAVKMKHKSQVRQNLKQNKRSSNHAGRNLGPSDLSPWACAGGYLTPGEMLSFAFTQLMWARLRTLGGVCIDTALLCSRRKTWSHLMLLIASWLIRFTRNCQTLKPQIIISHNKRIYCAINFLAGFPKVKSLTAVKLLLHILIYFSLQLGNVSKSYSGLLHCHCLCIKITIFVFTYSIHCQFETYATQVLLKAKALFFLLPHVRDKKHQSRF